MPIQYQTGVTSSTSS